MRYNLLLRHTGLISNIFLISSGFFFSPSLHQSRKGCVLKPFLFAIFKHSALTHFCVLFQLLWYPPPRSEDPSLCLPWGQVPGRVCILLIFSAPTASVRDSIWTKPVLGCLVWLYYVANSPMSCRAFKDLKNYKGTSK